MTANLKPVQSLRKYFDTGSVSRLTRALANNGLIWKALESETFTETVYHKLGDTVEVWNPGSIALTALEADNPELARILTSGAKDIQPSRTVVPLEKLEEHLSNSFSCDELVDAALSVCGMLVKSNEEGSWEWLQQKNTAVPKEIISILLPFVDYAPGVIRSLISSNNVSEKTIVQSILSTPHNDEGFTSIFTQFLTDAELASKSRILTELAASSETISKTVAASLLPNISYSSDDFLKIRDLKQAAEIASMADMPNESIQMLEEARKLQSDFEADLLLSISKNHLKLDDISTASEYLDMGANKAASAKSLKAAAKTARTAGKNLPAEIFNPSPSSELSLEEILMHLEFSRLNNQSIAIRKELNQLIQHPDFNKLDNSTKRETASALVNFDAVEAANSLLRALLSDNPNDIETLSASARAQMKSRDLAAALKTVQYIQVLAPENLENSRSTAELYADAGMPEKALEIFQSIVKETPNPSTYDHLGLAKSALAVGNSQIALEILEDLSASENTSAEIMRLTGKAWFDLGEPDKALPYFKDAFSLDNSSKKTLLALSKYYRSKGMLSIARDFLQNTIADTGLEPLDISLELWDIFGALEDSESENEILEKIYNRLERGIQLYWLPDRPPIYQKLAEAFLERGDSAKTIDLLQKSFAISADSSTAVNLSQMLNKKKDFAEAYQIIEPVINQGNINSHSAAAYASACLGTSKSLKKAGDLLESILENSEDIDTNLELLLAKIYYQLEEYSKTNYIINDILEEAPSEETRIDAVRVKAKLLANEERLDEAIQLIKQTSLNTTSDTTGLSKDLVEYFYEAGLSKDALRDAKLIYSRNQSNLETLQWYASMMELLQEPEEKLTALKKSAEIFPDEIDSWIALGKTYAALGKTRDANAAFEKGTNLPTARGSHLITAGETMAGFGCYKHALPFLEKAQQSASAPNQLLTQLLVKSYSENKLERKAVELLNYQIEENPQVPENWLLLADLFVSMKEQENALETMEKTKFLHSENHLFELKNAYVYRAFGDFKSALESIEKALIINPLSTLAKFKGAQYAYYAKDLITAEKYLENVNLSAGSESLSENLPIRDILVLKSQIKRDIGDTDDAKALIASMEFTSLEPEPKSSALLSQLYSWQADDKNAVLWLDKAISQTNAKLKNDDPLAYGEALLEISRAYSLRKDYAKSLSAVKQAAKSMPNEVSGYQQLTEVLIEQANYYHMLEEAGVINNRPQPGVVSDKTYSILSKSLNNALRFNTSGSNITKLNQLKSAASAAFKQDAEIPDWSNASEFDNLSAEALIRYFTRKNDWKNAAAAAEKSSKSTASLFAEAKALAKSAPELASEKISQGLNLSSGDPAAHALAAKHYAGRKDYETALNHISSALQKMDNEPEWHALAGDCFAAVGSMQPALYHYNTAVELMPGNPNLLHKTAELYLEDGSPSSAVELLEKATRLNKKDPEILLTLAKAQIELKAFSKAVRYAEKAASIKPDDFGLQTTLAEICLDAGQPKKALKTAVQLENSAYALDDTLMIQAKAYLQLKDTQNALKYIDRGILKAVDPLPFEIQKTALLKDSMSPDDYLNEIRTLTEKHPQSPAVLVSYSKALQDMKNSEEAVFAAQKALQLCADKKEMRLTAEVHSHLGNLLRDIGQKDQAIHHLSKAVEINPKSIENYQSIAEAFVDRKDFSQAIDSLENAISNDPNNAALYTSIANVYKECKDYTNAEKMLKKAAELDPNNNHIQRQLVGILALNIIHSN